MAELSDVSNPKLSHDHVSTIVYDTDLPFQFTKGNLHKTNHNGYKIGCPIYKKQDILKGDP